MMANGWKTPEQIQEDYAMSKPVFYKYKSMCEASKFSDAIQRPSGRITYIIEPIWQKFLIWQSEEYKKQHMDPHLRSLSN